MSYAIRDWLSGILGAAVQGTEAMVAVQLSAIAQYLYDCFGSTTALQYA